MLSIRDIQKIDVQKICLAYERWPTLARESYKKKNEQLDLKNIDHFVFAGMGGSGTLGDTFNSIMSKTDIHVSVIKGYKLPKTVDKNTLVISTSVSGNTQETISILKQVKKTSAKSISFSTNGHIEKYCFRNKLQYRQVKKNHSPRASFPSFLYTMLMVLKPMLPIKNTDIISSIKKLEFTQKKNSVENLTRKNTSLNLAEWMDGIPLIYYPYGLNAAATRFKNSLQENAKTHAIIEDVIEASHNGIVAMEKPSDVKPILLRGKDDSKKTKERFDIFKEYFKENNLDFREIFSVNGNIITKIVNLIYLLDYASIYMAIKSKTDPSPVNSIDYIKKRLK
jgi:glucose/mannose-6-phosphate isomerase